MFHMSWSMAESISLEGWERVLQRPAQESLRPQCRFKVFGGPFGKISVRMRAGG